MPITVNRPILSLSPHVWWALRPLLAVLALAVLGASGPLIAAAAALFLLSTWQCRWLWRLAWRVRQFRTLTDGSVVLHYEPGLERGRDLRLLMDWCREDHDRLA